MKKILLNGNTLDFETVYLVAHHHTRIAIDKKAFSRVKASRRLLFKIAEKGQSVYGLNTGVGWNKDQKVSEDSFERYNRNVLNSHALGIGPLCSVAEVRAMMLIRLNTALCCSSGISPEILTCYETFLNKDLHPIVPSRGSVGMSDITILSHIGLVMIGEGEALYKGVKMSGSDALKSAGLTPVILGPKDALSIISSNAYSTALGALLIRETENIIKLSNAVYCLGLEALNGVVDPLDLKVNELRKFKGQMTCAESCRQLLEGSYLFESHSERALQDPLSYRDAASINGAVLDALDYVKAQLRLQMNATDDNPCLILDEKRLCGSSNFETTSWVIGIEMLAIALSHLSKAACNRMIKLVDPAFTKLSRFLTPKEGEVIAYGTIQKTFMSLDAEIRMLANPSSMDYFALAGNIEDHATNAPLALDKVKKIIDNLRYIIGIEAMHAAQAIDLRGNTRLGQGTQVLYNNLRSVIPFLEEDRNLSIDIQKAYTLMSSDTLVNMIKCSSQNFRLTIDDF
jgi:histidine ammonia-lyase